jgi:Lrp/AsnC family transcriptional regulator, leucine-responsive regulatory protein
MIKIDKIDLKILAALDLDTRASFNQLGKAARVSKETAQYRFNQLINKKIITQFFIFVNPAKIGYNVNKILVKYKSVTKKIQEEIESFLTKNENVAWAGNTEGKWDLHITTFSKSKKEFSDFYMSFFKKFGRFFKEKEILMPINNPIFNDKYLSNGNLLYEKIMDARLDKEEIDEIDKKILKILSSNSRTMLTEIGEKVKLSYWAVAQRIKRLEKKEIIIVFKTRIDFKKLGYSYYHLFIELRNEDTRKKINEYYKNYKDCVMTMEHLGKYSMHIEFVIKEKDMREAISDFREKFGKDVEGYEIVPITKEYTINLIK